MKKKKDSFYLFSFIYSGLSGLSFKSSTTVFIVFHPFFRRISEPKRTGEIFFFSRRRRLVNIEINYVEYIAASFVSIRFFKKIKIFPFTSYISLSLSRFVECNFESKKKAGKNENLMILNFSFKK